jgi:uncharacterized membrane protein YeiH
MPLPQFPSVLAIEPLVLLDLTGLVVFAVTGALVASRKQMDIVSFALLATVTGIGGGTIRDLLLGRTVAWIADPLPVAVCIGVSIVVFFTAHIPESRYRVLLWLDALGMAAVAVRGADIAIDHGAGPMIAVLMGVITATFGGIIRDILGGEETLILRREIYVTAAFLAATGYIGLIGLGVSSQVAGPAGFLAGFALRGLALRYNWALPPYRSRPARPRL